MDQPRLTECFTEVTLRGFLDRRERELAEQIRELKALLAPKQIEFAEVRRTKASLGIAATTSVVDMVGELDDLNHRMLATAVRQVPPKEMTIKDLIVRALVEHFQQGATPAQLGDFICSEYGRAIEPGSIRPNLVRLREAGLIVHDGLASRWILNPAAAGTLLLHFSTENQELSPLLKAAAGLAWRDDCDKTWQEQLSDHEKNLAQETHKKP